MIKVVFVGDEPSTSNIDIGIAFVGAQSFTRLVSWIRMIDPDYYLCVDSYRSQDLRCVELLYSAGFKVIALGKKAEKRLKEHTYIDSIYSMPHPSGLNRRVNDKKLVLRSLEAAYEYVRK